MAAPIAYLYKGVGDAKLGRAPEIVETDRQWTGTQHWHVNCADPVAALLASGLPAKGDSWSPGLPNLTVRTRKFSHVAGGLTSPPLGPSDGGSGLVVVEVGYATAGGGGTLPAPSHGLKHTIIVPSVTSIQQMYDARVVEPLAGDPSLPPDSPVRLPIANGRGAQRAVGACQAKVFTYPTPATLDIVRLMDLQRNQRTNAGAVVLPPVYSVAGVPLSFEPGQLRYASFDVQSVDGSDESGSPAKLVQLTHTLDLSPDFLFRWCQEDNLGNAVGDVVETQLYRPASFDGLW